MSDRDEDGRLAALRAFGVLDTAAEPEFDSIVQQAARTLGTPIALLSLIDEDRQWLKAKVGLEIAETPRSMSFCTHAIQGDEVFVVENAKHDARFADNSLVTGDPNIRFYAGAPLKTDTGRRIGTICVIDSKPRAMLSDVEKTQLEALADRVMKALERRQHRIASAQRISATL